MKKTAVIFSAGEYFDSPTFPKPSIDLLGVKYDVVAMQKRLTQIGFDITIKENAMQNEYIPLLRQCAHGSPSDAIHIVYFSGHGGHYEGINYIYPSDFTSLYETNKNVNDAAINLEDIIDVYRGKGRLILIIDSCRKEFSFSKNYFSEMTSAENVYIAYATLFNDESIGNDNGISWFTEAICNEILTPNIDVDTLFTRIRQDIVNKHSVQIPSSVNTLLSEVVLHSELDYNDIDKKVYDFIKKHGDDYTDKYGYWHGDDLVFIDAAQYFDIGLLDALWSFRKVDNKIYRDKGINVPELTEDEYKTVALHGLFRGKKYFECDENHVWYYDGRQIRMGEIPPLPASMRHKAPEPGKKFSINIDIKRENEHIIIETNLPQHCELFIKINDMQVSKKYNVNDGKIILDEAISIHKIKINSKIFTSDPQTQLILGEKCRNLTGEHITYEPIYGNFIKYEIEL